MADVNKLRKVMKEKNITYETLSDKLKIRPEILDKKLGGTGGIFTVGEAEQIVKILGLTAETATEIFFADCIVNETKN